MTASSSLRILVQGTADWNQPIATNQHYVVRELAKDFELTFVESLGLRTPEFRLRDFRRMARRLFGVTGPRLAARAVPHNVNVVSPKIVPIHTDLWRPLNTWLLRNQLRKFQRDTIADVYWTYSPITYGMEMAASASVYHCVDLYGEFPGIDSAVIDIAEKRLATAGFQAVGSSEVVVEHLRNQGFGNVIYWPNVADTSAIADVRNAMDWQERDGAIFAGNLTDRKVDFDLLESVVRQGTPLHLAGPIAEGGGTSSQRVEELVHLGATYHGTLRLAELSALMLRCNVGLIPYLTNSYTLGVSPLKTYEYLAAGLSVVATPLPGVQPIADRVLTPVGHTSFVSAVQSQLIEATSTEIDARIQLANEHSWEVRGLAARTLVSDLATKS